jgi:apolipoprotein N-acyltransferase
MLFARSFVTMIVFNAISLYWIGGWESDDIFLKLGGIVTVIIHPFFFMIPIFLTYLVYRAGGRKYALILFPLLWTGFEYWHNLTEFAFPWIELGNTEVYNINRIQYAEYFGVHGITFLICVISSLLFFVISKIYNGSWKLKSTNSIVTASIIILLILLPNIWSSIILSSRVDDKQINNTDITKQIKSVIIQPNVDPFRKWTGNRDSLVDKYIYHLNEALKFNSNLMVIHETAVPYYFLEDYNFYNTSKFINFVNQNKKYVLMGIPNIKYFNDSNSAPADSRIMSDSRRRYKVHNSAILLEPYKDKENFQIHSKVKLVPFSENAPYGRQLPFITKWIRWGVGISVWDEGDSLKVITMNNASQNINTKFTVLICFESVFSEYASEASKNGAEFLVIITNDGWFGHSSGPEQHKQIAVLRAIENRKWIIRAAQTGISCFIDPYGNISDEIPLSEIDMKAKTITANTVVTFYSQHGDIIGTAGYYSCWLTLVLGIVIYYVKKKK